MIVKELIEMLSVLDQEAVVVLQKDPEGNSFSHIEGADGGAICVEANDDLEVLDSSWSAEEAGFDDEDEWDEFKTDAGDCVVIYPSN